MHCALTCRSWASSSASVRRKWQVWSKSYETKRTLVYRRPARFALLAIADQIEALAHQIGRLEREIVVEARCMNRR